MTDSNEFEIPEELKDFEQKLKSLKPAAHLIDSHEMVFEAGRQSVLLERETSATLTGRASRQRNSAVPALLGALVGTAATILIMLSAGILERAGGPPVADTGSQQSSAGDAGETIVATEEPSSEPLVSAESGAIRNLASTLDELDNSRIKHGVHAQPVLTTAGRVHVEHATGTFTPVDFTDSIESTRPSSYLDLLNSL